MKDVGDSITNCVSFLSEVWSECDALTRLIKEDLSELFCRANISEYKQAGSWEDSYSTTDLTGWVHNGIGSSLPIVEGKKRKPSKYLVFQISLSGGGISVEGNCQPLIHIGFWNDSLDFNECQMHFPLDVDNFSSIKLHNNILFKWDYGNGREEISEWLFSIRLTSINTRKNIKDKIVEPVRKLLNKESPDEDIFRNIEGIVNYEMVGDDNHIYRVVSDKK